MAISPISPAISTRKVVTRNGASRMCAELELKGDTGSRDRVLIAYDHAIGEVENHERALRALLAKRADQCAGANVWSDPRKWIPGATDSGFVFVRV